MMEVNGDLLDDGLQAVMGKDRCQDATRPVKPKKDRVPDAAWEPAPHAPTDLERVRLAVMALAPYVVLMGVIFWWQQSGRLDSTTGFYTLIALALLAGVSIGRAGAKKEV